MRLNNLSPHPQSTKKRKILGRGRSSGHGGSSTRGTKGQRARSGDGQMPDFAGGQMPLVRIIPKRGFTNKFSVQYAEVNLDILEKKFAAGEMVDPDALRSRKIVRRNLPVKILGGGQITKPLKIKAHRFSAGALQKIKKAGGEAEIIK